MKAKTKPTPRARRMWANYYPENPTRPVLYKSRKSAKHSVAFWATHVAVPVAVIPLDNPEALINNAVKGFFRGGQLDAYSDMRAALTAIGVLPRKGGRK